MTDGAEVITVTLGDKTFRAGRRTAAHLEWTIERLAAEHPDAHLHVTQPCYNTDVPASAGTHDKDGVLDVAIEGLAWWVAQRFLRTHGWAAWFRHTGQWAAIANWHIHMVSLGCPGPVGEFVPGQVDDYYRHTFGLAGQHNTDADPSWFPGDEGPAPWPVGTPEQWRRDIDLTVFDYPAWEDDMPLSDEDIAKVAEAVWAHIVREADPKTGVTEQTAEAALKKAANR